MADAIGGIITHSGGKTIHTFTSSGSFIIPKLSVEALAVEVLVVGGGGGGGMDMGGGGGGGGVIHNTNYTITSNTIIPVTIGAGGSGAPAGGTSGQPTGHQFTVAATSGKNTIFGSLVAIGGGFGGSSYRAYTPGIAGGAGGSGGGASGYNDNAGTFYGGAGTSGQGNRGGNSTAAYYSGGGGGAGAAGADSTNQPNGGAGFQCSINGTNLYWGGGGGGASYSLSTGGNGGIGGGGGGAIGTTTGGAGLNAGAAGGGGAPNSWANTPGGNGGANTGGGGGGGSHYNANNKGGDGGSGIVIISYTSNQFIVPVDNYLSKYRKDRFVGYVEKGRQIENTPLFNDPNLVGYWKLDGNSLDSKASNNGTDTSMTYSEQGKYFGKSACFNGSTSHISVTNINHQASDFSYSWWTKWSATVRGTQTYFENGTWSNSLIIRQETYNIINIWAMGTNYSFFNFVPIVGKWHHLCLVRSGNTLYLYADGQLCGTLAFSVTITPSANMWFGASQHSSTQCITAFMSDIAIFSRALTEAEIRQICFGFKELNNLQDYKRLENNEVNPEIEEGELMSPTNISGCKAWIDISKLTGLSDGNAISSAPDLSGNGNNLAQISAGQNPLYKTNVLNGLATMRGTAAASSTFYIPWGWSRASGGTISQSGDYTIHIFTSNANFVTNSPLTCEVLIIAGGGGGGSKRGGGGGAGGRYYNSTMSLTSGTYSVVIGGGGAGASANANNSTAGGNSVFNGQTAYGGGRGGGYNGAGGNGGCGGGGGSGEGGSYTYGSPSQGYRGGSAVNYGGGGGGGMGGQGIDHDGNANANGKNGGIGVAYSITGTSTYYSGGGGGGARTTSNVGGTGGAGGGGNGNANGNGYAATYYGGGGGGAGDSPNFIGGNGYQGIVIIKYRTPQSSIYYIGRKTSTGGRVLSGRSNNFLLGYWNNYKQQAYYEGWIDTNSDVANETAFHVWTGISNTTSYLMEDGKVVKYGTGGVSPPAGITIGHLGASEFSDFDIGEIIGYNRDLNSRERELVSNYLLKKWGMDYNLALMKPVTTSWASTNPWNVTDGSTWTDSYVGVNGTASVTIDLLKVYDVSRVDIFHYWWDGRTYYYNKVETSPDGVTWTTRFDSEVTGRYAETYKGKTITFTATPVRYVKHTLNGSSVNTGSHFSEVRVMGK